jgi:hypothetical protein
MNIVFEKRIMDGLSERLSVKKDSIKIAKSRDGEACKITIGDRNNYEWSYVVTREELRSIINFDALLNSIASRFKENII